MQPSDFKILRDDSSKHKLRLLGQHRPMLRDILCLQVRRGEGAIYIKTDFNLHRFCSYSVFNGIPESLSKARGVNQSKTL